MENELPTCVGSLLNPIDCTLLEGGVWQSASFTVPSDVLEERVQFHGDKYMRRFGDWLERVGFQVLSMSRPRVYLGKLPVERGRRKYCILAWCRRRPVELHADVPDVLVPELLMRGMQLAE